MTSAPFSSLLSGVAIGLLITGSVLLVLLFSPVPTPDVFSHGVPAPHVSLPIKGWVPHTAHP